MNTVANIGHNQSPGKAEIARDVFNELSRWLDNNPVIQTHERAKEAAQLIKRARIALAELDEERTEKVRPLNDTVSSINGAYKVVSAPLTKMVTTLKVVLKDHLDAEEARRLAEAEQRYREAQAAVEALRRAQEAERQAIEDAKEGVVGTKIGETLDATEKAHEAVHRAVRAAQIADKDSIARVSPGFGRTMSMRNIEVLVVADAGAAFNKLWTYSQTEIGEALIKSAKAYRKEFGYLPVGISERTERKL